VPRKPKELTLLDGTSNDMLLEREFQTRVIEYARLQGWLVYSIPDSRRSTLSGWPDLTLVNRTQRRLVFAELKREKGRLRPQQAEVLDVLTHIGGEGRTKKFEVYLWRPSDWDQVLKVLKR